MPLVVWMSSGLLSFINIVSLLYKLKLSAEQTPSPRNKCGTPSQWCKVDAHHFHVWSYEGQRITKFTVDPQWLQTARLKTNTNFKVYTTKKVMNEMLSQDLCFLFHCCFLFCIPFVIHSSLTFSDEIHSKCFPVIVKVPYFLNTF